MEARIAALRKEFEVEQEEAQTVGSEEKMRERALLDRRTAMARRRKTDDAEAGKVLRKR